VAALLAIVLGGLRVGLAAWRQGDDRAEAHQHLRSLAGLLSGSAAGAFPYRMAPQPGAAPAVQFQGEEGRLAFVTLSPPFPLGVPIAFTAVVFTLDEGERRGLAVRQKALPNFEPFEVGTPVVVDPTVTEITFRYLRPEGGWEARWNGETEGGLPRAVEIRLTVKTDGRVEPFPPLTVQIRSRLQ
jgi:hypothetical protein